jgi:hypothetical protein
MTMKTLTIKDLARTDELDSRTMASVRGGSSMYTSGYKAQNQRYAPAWDSSITATQNLLQQQSVTTATANGAAFVHGVHVNSDVHQDGENKIIG